MAPPAAPVAAAPTVSSSGGFPLTDINELKEQREWTKWSRQMQDWLILYNLWDNPATVLRCCTAIKTRCGQNARDLIENIHTQEGIWDKLTKHYKPQGTGMYMELLTQWDLCVKTPDVSIEEYARKFKANLTEQQGVDESLKLPEPYVIHRFMRGLGDEWQNFMTNLAANQILIGEKALQLEDIILRATNEEHHINAARTTTAMWAQPAPKTGTKRSYGDTKSNLPKCSSCTANGKNDRHAESNCWHLHPEKRPKWQNKKKPKTEESTTTVPANLSVPAVYTMMNVPGQAMMSSQVQELRQLVILDSGCAQHIFHQKKFFGDDLKPYATTTLGPGMVEVKQSGGIGTATMMCNVDGKPVEIRLPNAVYSPANGVNLVSETQLQDKGVNLRTTSTKRTMYKGDSSFNCSRWGGLWSVDLWDPTPTLASFNMPTDMLTWHARLGHLGPQNIAKLAKVSKGITLKRKREDDDHYADSEACCHHCASGKLTSRPHKGHIKPGESRLDLIHSDVAGPIGPDGFDGSRYYVSFRDDFSRMSEVHPIARKSEVFEKFRQFKAKHERPDRKIRRMRFDNGGEYMSTEFEKWLKDCGIDAEPTTRDSPEQNPVSERLNREIGERTRTTISSAGLPKNLWPEVVKTVNYLIMREPSTRLEGITPYEAWHEQQPDLSHLRTIGSLVWVKIVKYRAKLDARAEPFILVGYDKSSDKIYRVWDPRAKMVNHKIKRVFDVHIEERRVSPLDNSDKDTPVDKINLIKSAGEPQQIPASGETFRNQASLDADDMIISGPEPETALAARPDEQRQASPAPRDLTSRRSQDREFQTHQSELKKVFDLAEDGLKLPSWNELRDMSPDPLMLSAFINLKITPSSHLAMLSAKNSPEPFEPRSHQEAMRDAQLKMEWELAEKDEFGSLVENDVWTLVPKKSLPPGAIILRGKWVYSFKRGADGKVTRYKARWVVRGFEQREGIDYNETFASVVKPMSWKVLLALAAANDWEMIQMDVKTAFLYGLIDEEVYVEQPHGWEKVGEDLCCKLNRALYGLKQSPRLWYYHFFTFMEKQGFRAILADNCVFIGPDGTIAALYVDDLLITGPSKQGIATLKKALNEQFRMSDLGPVHYYLGMTITRDRQNRTLRLGQQAYVERVVRDHGQWDARPVYTPMETKLKPEPAPEGYEATAELRLKYQSAVGSLMYAMLGTRPDIAYAVSVVSRYAANPTDTHWGLVRRILRYLHTTVHLQLVYRGELKALSGYTDSDFAADSTRRSTAGYVFGIGSAAISWQSKRQPTVALSTCEAEYMGQTQAAKEALWLKQLLGEMRPHEAGNLPAVVIFGDNQGAIALAKNPVYHSRTKHMGIQQHWLREVIRDGQVELEYVPTHEQVADGLTKPLPNEPFKAFRKALGLEPPPGYPNTDRNVADNIDGLAA